MDDDFKTLQEAMVVKDRLRVLAELQAGYWDELISRGFDGSVAEQLVLDWSRHAYGMTFRSMPEPDVESELDELLGPASPPRGAHPPAPPANQTSDDPSRVPPGEPWLQLVQEPESEDVLDVERDDRAA